MILACQTKRSSLFMASIRVLITNLQSELSTLIRMVFCLMSLCSTPVWHRLKELHPRESHLQLLLLLWLGKRQKVMGAARFWATLFLLMMEIKEILLKLIRIRILLSGMILDDINCKLQGLTQLMLARFSVLKSSAITLKVKHTLTLRLLC